MLGLKPLLAAVALALASLATHAQAPLIAGNGVQVDFEAAYAYSLRVTNPDAYERSLARPGAALRVVENLYILGRVAEVAEREGLISPEEQNYLYEDVYRRTALERYLEQSIEVRSSDIDWEGLAQLEYVKQQSTLKSAEEVRAKHLLVAIDDVSFDAFVEKVAEVQDKLAQNHDFDELIRQYSDDPSAELNGGDLGFFTRQRMQPTFAEAAFSLLEAGDRVGPVMTVFGAHFIELVDRRAEQVLPFEKVKDRLVKEVRKTTRARLREELLSEFRAEIETELSTLDESSLRDRFISTYNAEASTSTKN